jgi:hypothetical protein
VMRRNSEEMLRNPQYQQMMRAMGVDIDALKQWGTEETKKNLRSLIYTVC